MEQKIGTFWFIDSEGRVERKEMKMAQQLSQGSGIKVHAPKHSFEAFNGENGLLSTEVEKLGDGVLKTFLILYLPRWAVSIYFWLCEVKSVS